MTSIQQREALQRQIWAIANKVRGAVDGWDFKQYVLGALFYRFISENFTSYIEAGDDSINYADLSDSIITGEIKEDAIKTKGYFIRPSDLFVNVVKNADSNENLNTDLAHIFDDIEASASGFPSERDIKGLFADFDTTSNRLGNTVKDKNARLAAVLKGVAELDFGDFTASHIDLFGDAYEFLISNYAANAGKSGGEFFTPQHVSKLIAQLAMHGQASVNKIYDPACGSGSLLLQAKKHFNEHIIEEGFFGQEINHTTYNLARMNMFLHNINYDKFNIQLGNTLTEPHFGDDKPFDAIVSNPPYSVKWIGSDDPTLINDERFAPAGVLAPKSKADFAFVLHALSYLSSKGRAAIVCFPGIFYRGGAEQKIRKYLVDNNYVESVISLAPNLFYGTTIAVNILVLAKNKKETTTQFIDASSLSKKETNNNVLLDTHIDQIMQVFDSKENVDHFAQSVPLEKVVANDYNLSVNSYVEAKDNREVVDIAKLNPELKTTAARIEQLRTEIDVVVAEIEGKALGEMSNLSFMEKLLHGVEVVWKSIGEVTLRTRNIRWCDTTRSHRYIDLTSVSIETKKIIETSVVAASNAPSRAQKLVEKDDVIFATTRPTQMRYCLIDEKYSGEVASTGYCVLRAKKDAVLPKWILHWLSSGEFKKYLEENQSGSAYPAISDAKVKEFKIPIPYPDNPKKSLEIQAEIVRILDTFTELTT